MYILSLETSTKNFSLAVSRNEKVLRFRNVLTERTLETSMITSIDRLLKDCGLNLKDIDALAVGLGPGSFTSLRVGLATIKAFALAMNKKIVGIGSLDVIANAVNPKDIDEICVMVDARRGQVYSAIYDKTFKRKTDYMLTTVENVLKQVRGVTLFTGDASGLYKKQVEEAYKQHAGEESSKCRAIFAAEKFWFPHSKELAKLAFERLDHHKSDDPHRIVPIYLYPQDCQVDRK